MILLVLPNIPMEDELMARARQGSEEALLEIYEQYFPPVFQFIRLRVTDVTHAEDIASEVFVKLIESVRRKRAPHSSLRGWLFRVARNELAQHYGRARQFPTTTLDEWLPMSEGDDLEADFIRSLGIERARRALRMLVADQQEVLLLRFGQMLSLEETADVMDRNVNAIKALQFRAVNNLRQILADVKKVAHG